MEYTLHAQNSATPEFSLAAKIQEFIENVFLPWEKAALVVEMDSIAYGPLPSRCSFGVVIEIPPMFPPHMLQGALFDHGGLALLKQMQGALKEADRTPHDKAHAKRLRQLAQTFPAMLNNSLVDMLNRHAAMAQGAASQFNA